MEIRPLEDGLLTYRNFKLSENEKQNKIWHEKMMQEESEKKKVTN
jgi:hypothetical protein